MTCACVYWCRVPDAEPNTYGGRFAMSHHHPDCAEYKAKEYTVLELDGVRCVCEPCEAKDMLADDDDPSAYKISTVMLTEDQVEALPEFMGF